MNKRRNNLYGILELHGKDAPNLGDLTVRIRELNAQQKKLEDDLARVDDETAPAIKVTDEEVNVATATMARIVRNTSQPAKLRALMGTFIERIMLNSEDVAMGYRPERIVRNEKRREPVVRSADSWLPDLDSNQGPAD